MKDHYDFSKGQRGKFYKPDAVFRLSVYLDERIQDYLSAKAEAKGIDLSELVNDILKKDIELIEMSVIGCQLQTINTKSRSSYPQGGHGGGFLLIDIGRINSVCPACPPDF